MTDELERLRELGPTEPRLVGPSESELSIAELIAGECVVFGRPHRIIEPVDWLQDPYDSRSWRYELHAFTWMKPLLLAYAEQGELEALEKARRALLDWASTNLEPTGEVSEFAWYDMAVGLRAPYFAYVLRQSLHEHGSREGDELLLRAAKRHGAELADEDNYYAGHNHGLFQDEGLYILAAQLPILNHANDWKEQALRRLRATLATTVDLETGAHLEHSSAYQFTIVGLVSRLRRNVPEMPGLGELEERLRATAAWHVTPSGRLAQLGDTDDIEAPQWARKAAAELHGMNAIYASGQVFVVDGESYLAVSAAHHGYAHKHSDDTGFVLVEDGVTVFGDAGRWGYYEDEPDRLYARSAHAHNVLTVDDADFPWLGREPYGSGLIDAGAEGGWYRILVHNPLLSEQEVEHRRLFLYRPGDTLIVIDSVDASEPHQYERRFHFGPELEVEQRGSLHAFAPGLNVSLTIPDPKTDVQLDRGAEKPEVSGWTYPADRQRTPISTATVTTAAKGAQLVAVVRLDRR